MILFWVDCICYLCTSLSNDWLRSSAVTFCSWPVYNCQLWGIARLDAGQFNSSMKAMERDPSGDTELTITYWLFGPMLGVGNLNDGQADAQDRLILFLGILLRTCHFGIDNCNWLKFLIITFSVKCHLGSFFPSHPYPIIPLGMCLLQLDSTRYASSSALSRLCHCSGGNKVSTLMCLLPLRCVVYLLHPSSGSLDPAGARRSSSAKFSTQQTRIHTPKQHLVDFQNKTLWWGSPDDRRRSKTVPELELNGHACSEILELTCVCRCLVQSSTQH